MRRLQNDSIFQRGKVVLRNHVIKTVTVDHPIKCQEECLNIPLCFSVNVHPHQGSSRQITCDLNDSSKTADPKDLVPNDGYQYRRMALSCVKVNNYPIGLKRNNSNSQSSLLS